MADLTIVSPEWGVPPPLVIPKIAATSPIDRARQLEAALKSPPGQTRVNLAGVDQQGFVWLNVFVSDKDAPSAGTEVHFLEIVDPAKGELVYSQRVPMSNLRLIPSGVGLRAYAASEGSDGVLKIEVWKLELVGR